MNCMNNRNNINNNNDNHDPGYLIKLHCRKSPMYIRSNLILGMEESSNRPFHTILFLKSMGCGGVREVDETVDEIYALVSLTEAAARGQ